MSEYMQGKQDCKNGDIPKQGMTEEYYRGFDHEYQREQILDARTYEQQNNMGNIKQNRCISTYR